MTSRELEQIYERMHKPVPPGIATPSANKFNARKKLVDGILFDSTGEAQAYQILKLQEKAGVISCLRLQPSFALQHWFREPGTGKLRRAVRYRADFQFIRNGREVVVDFKGHQTEVYRVKVKLFRSRFPDLDFEEWTKATLASL